MEQHFTRYQITGIHIISKGFIQKWSTRYKNAQNALSLGGDSNSALMKHLVLQPFYPKYVVHTQTYVMTVSQKFFRLKIGNTDFVSVFMRNVYEKSHQSGLTSFLRGWSLTPLWSLIGGNASLSWLRRRGFLGDSPLLTRVHIDLLTNVPHAGQETIHIWKNTKLT